MILLNFVDAHVAMIILLVHFLNAPLPCSLLCLGLQLAGLLPQGKGSGINF